MPSAKTRVVHKNDDLAGYPCCGCPVMEVKPLAMKRGVQAGDKASANTYSFGHNAINRVATMYIFSEMDYPIHF